jgi:arylsulfatase A-like enzyme
MSEKTPVPFFDLPAASERPNIVIILVDDMGWSDIGCYGSEIPTPNLDSLANNSLRFTQFYNTGRCSPTRASLLTGHYPHQAGMEHLDGTFKLLSDNGGNAESGPNGRYEGENPGGAARPAQPPTGALDRSHVYRIGTRRRQVPGHLQRS